MKQSKLASLAESLINIVVGFAIACAAQAIFLPLLGVPIPWSANFAFAAIMTVISIARSYALRRLFEALHIRHPVSPFALAVLAERRRQQEIEGWTAGHDDAHAPGELARAGVCYALSAEEWARWPEMTAYRPPMLRSTHWPWRAEDWKPTGVRRDLVKATALLLAEGERFDRTRRRSVAGITDGNKRPPLPPLPAPYLPKAAAWPQSDDPGVPVSASDGRAP